MQPLGSVAVYILVVFIGSALLSPWVYELIQSLAHSFPRLAQIPFHRVVNRMLLVLAISGLWPLLRSLGLKSARDLGFVKPRGQWTRLGAGFLLGFASLAILAVGACFAGTRAAVNSISPGHLLVKMAGAILTAVTVGLIEETLFRGVLFGGLRRAYGWINAMLASSMVYAIVHFLARVEPNGPITWHSGLELLPRMLKGFANTQDIIPAFLNLTVVGALLAVAYERTGNLFFSIGLHGGWVFWLKSYGVLTRDAGGPSSVFWGTGKLIDGWAALIVLAVTSLAMCRLPVLNTSPTTASPELMKE